MGGIQDYKEHNHHIGFTCGGHNFLHLAHEIQLFIIMELLCMTQDTSVMVQCHEVLQFSVPKAHPMPSPKVLFLLSKRKNIYQKYLFEHIKSLQSYELTGRCSPLPLMLTSLLTYAVYPLLCNKIQCMVQVVMAKCVSLLHREYIRSHTGQWSVYEISSN